MRTTLTIDDDLAGILKRRARELDKPFKELVNLALRKGLAASLDDGPQRIAVRPHDFANTRSGIDSDSFDTTPDFSGMTPLQILDWLAANPQVPPGWGENHRRELRAMRDRDAETEEERERERTRTKVAEPGEPYSA